MEALHLIHIGEGSGGGRQAAGGGRQRTSRSAAVSIALGSARRLPHSSLSRPPAKNPPPRTLASNLAPQHAPTYCISAATAAASGAASPAAAAATQMLRDDVFVTGGSPRRQPWLIFFPHALCPQACGAAKARCSRMGTGELVSFKPQPLLRLARDHINPSAATTAEVVTRRRCGRGKVAPPKLESPAPPPRFTSKNRTLGRAAFMTAVAWLPPSTRPSARYFRVHSSPASPFVPPLPPHTLPPPPSFLPFLSHPLFHPAAFYTGAYDGSWAWALC